MKRDPHAPDRQERDRRKGDQGWPRGVAPGAAAVAAILLAAAPAPAQERLDRSGFGAVALCDSLAVVARQFPDARDTTFHEGGESWPGRTVRFEDGVVVFVAAPLDPARIFRIRTTRPSVRGPGGVRPGQLVHGLLDRGAELEPALPEGEVWFLWRGPGVGMTLDSASARAVWKRWRPGAEPEELVPDRATVRSIQVGRRCEGSPEGRSRPDSAPPLSGPRAPGR